MANSKISNPYSKIVYTPEAENSRITFHENSYVAERNGILTVSLRFTLNVNVTSVDLLGTIGTTIPKNIQLSCATSSGPKRIGIDANGGIFPYESISKNDVVFITYAVVK